jgi:hypothetical protein
MAKQRVLRYRPDGGASSIYTDTEGIARVLSPLGGSPIGVKAEGYRPAFLAQVTGERTVVVARPLELELRIAGELPAGVKVRLWLKWVGEPDRLSRDCTVSAELDRGVVKLRMPRPGPYVAQCEFSHRQGAPAALAEVGSGGKTVFAESRLVVHDSAALQPVELKVDAGAMRQALADYDAWLGRFKR